MPKAKKTTAKKTTPKHTFLLTMCNEQIDQLATYGSCRPAYMATDLSILDDNVHTDEYEFDDGDQIWEVQLVKKYEPETGLRLTPIK